MSDLQAVESLATWRRLIAECVTQVQAVGKNGTVSEIYPVHVMGTRIFHRDVDQGQVDRFEPPAPPPHQEEEAPHVNEHIQWRGRNENVVVHNRVVRESGVVCDRIDFDERHSIEDSFRIEFCRELVGELRNTTTRIVDVAFNPGRLS